MSDSIWNVMVEVQMSRRGRDIRPEPRPVRRRKRPTTLRSIRTLLVDDHYALLAESGY